MNKETREQDNRVYLFSTFFFFTLLDFIYSVCFIPSADKSISLSTTQSSLFQCLSGFIDLKTKRFSIKLASISNRCLNSLHYRFLGSPIGALKQKLWEKSPGICIWSEHLESSPQWPIDFTWRHSSFEFMDRMYSRGGYFYMF